MLDKVEPRQVIGVCQFAAGPGREREAAEAWAFELTHYFKRGVGEAPRVTYANGVYTCEGLMQTTHPFDYGDRVEFDKDAPPWNLDFCTNPTRRVALLELDTPDRQRWDGR